MFRYIPAGLDSCQEAPTTIYVKYGSFSNEMKILNQNPYMLQVQLPDRILTIAQDSDKISHYKHFDWDECLPISPLHKTSDNIDYPDFAMINYVANYGRFHKAAKSCKLGKKSNRLKIVCDSGGFQVAMGRVDYIDTKNLAHFYNENTDIGIVLDIPLYRGIEMPDLIKFAKMQKKNTDRLLDYKDSSVELLNVCHGYDLDKYCKYIDITMEDSIERLCIGGLNFSKSIVCCLSDFIRLVERYKYKYKHFHILGIYNPSMLAPFIYLAETMFKDVLITSDSSTALQSARSGMYHLQREFNKSPERLMIGSIHNKLTKFNKFRLLPCSCPICRMIKYMDVFSFLLSNPVIRCLTIHNIMEINKTLMSLANLANSVDYKDYQEIVKKMLRGHLGDVILGFSYVESVLQDGVDKADKNFRQFFNMGIFNSINVSNLGTDEKEIFNSGVESYKNQVNSVYDKYKSGKCVETFKTIKFKQ